MQAVKQPVTLESFNHQEALKIILLSDELWWIISVALLILLQALYILYKTWCDWKDCEKLNKETCLCKV